MNGILIQHWQFGYAGMALLVAGVATVVEDHLRSGNPPGLAVRCGAASLAGVAWPLAIIGVVEFWAIAMLVHRLSPTPSPSAAGPAPRELVGAGSH